MVPDRRKHIVLVLEKVKAIEALEIGRDQNTTGVDFARKEAADRNKVAPPWRAPEVEVNVR